MTGLVYMNLLMLWILTGTLYVAVFLLYRHFGRQLVAEQERRNALGPKLDSPLEGTVTTTGGQSHQIGRGSLHPQVLLFTAVGCKSCDQIKPSITSLAKNYGDLDVVVFHHGDIQSTGRYMEGMPSNVVAVTDESSREVSRKWKIPGTPFLIATDSGGVVRRKGGGVSRRLGREIFEAAARASEIRSANEQVTARYTDVHNNRT